MQAKFRKKLRSLFVTVPVLRDLRAKMPTMHADATPSMAFSLEDDTYGDSDDHDGSDEENQNSHRALLAAESGGMSSQATHQAQQSSAPRLDDSGSCGGGDGIVASEDTTSLSLTGQTRAMAQELKEQGNVLVKQSKFAEALVLYDQSIALWDQDPAGDSTSSTSTSTSTRIRAVVSAAATVSSRSTSNSGNAHGSNSTSTSTSPGTSTSR